MHLHSDRFIKFYQFNKKMRKIYVASPLGFSEAGRFFMYEKLIPLIESKGFQVLDPWKLTPQDEIDKVLSIPYGQERKLAWTSLDQKIGRRNAEAINESNGITAVLDGVDVDSGTASEIGYGAALRKPVLGYKGDFRVTSDNEGTLINLQVDYFIHLNGGKIVTSLDELKNNLYVFK